MRNLVRTPYSFSEFESRTKEEVFFLRNRQRVRPLPESIFLYFLFVDWDQQRKEEETEGRDDQQHNGLGPRLERVTVLRQDKFC